MGFQQLGLDITIHLTSMQIPASASGRHFAGGLYNLSSTFVTLFGNISQLDVGQFPNSLKPRTLAAILPKHFDYRKLENNLTDINEKKPNYKSTTSFNSYALQL